MPRARDPNRNKAKELYNQHNGNITNREVANTLGVDEKVVAVWKQRDQWNVVQQSKSKVVQQKKNNNINTEKSIAKEVDQVMSNPELTDKQRLFCLNYIKCFNATKAYQKAYDCSYETAMTEGCKALRNPKIADQIAGLKQGKFNQSFLQTEDIVQRYVDIAFADITDYADFGTREVTFSDNEGREATTDMSYVDAKPAWMVDGTLLSEVSMGKGGIKIKLLDQMKALQWLTDHMDLLTTEQKARVKHMQNKDKLERERFEHQKDLDERSNF